MTWRGLTRLGPAEYLGWARCLGPTPSALICIPHLHPSRRACQWHCLVRRQVDEAGGSGRVVLPADILVDSECAECAGRFRMARAPCRTRRVTCAAAPRCCCCAASSEASTGRSSPRCPTQAACVSMATGTPPLIKAAHSVELAIFLCNSTATAGFHSSLTRLPLGVGTCPLGPRQTTPGQGFAEARGNPKQTKRKVNGGETPAPGWASPRHRAHPPCGLAPAPHEPPPRGILTTGIGRPCPRREPVDRPMWVSWQSPDTGRGGSEGGRGRKQGG